MLTAWRYRTVGCVSSGGASVVVLAASEDYVHVGLRPGLEAAHRLVHLRENIAGAGLALSDEDVAELDHVGR